MTPAALAEAALFYLSRYATSSGNLRRVLARKVAKSAAHHGDDASAFAPIIDDLVAQHVKAGSVNDMLYAESQVRKQRNRGRSARLIVQSLGVKGLPGEVVTDIAAALREEDGDMAAAIQLAKRRRLGPFRLANRSEQRQRDLATLGRAGFGYHLAAKVIDAADTEALAEMLDADN
jgi:regulatory protein